MPRYLIINADDFGLCDAANEAVFDLFKNGFLKSSTIMMPCPKAKEAVEFSKSNPQYSIGIHLTLTNEWEERWPWGPLTDGQSIKNSEGRMWPENEDFEAHCNYSESIAEARAQIELAEKMGMNIVQVDNHMGSLYGMNGKYLMLPKVFKLCRDKGYPFRMCTTPKDEFCPDGVPLALYNFFCRFSGVLSKLYKVPTPDYLILTDQVECLKNTETYEQFRDAFLEFHGKIPEGITETFVHPALDTEEMKSITGTWKRRYWEYLLMKDPTVEKYFKEKDIELISYKEMVRLISHRW